LADLVHSVGPDLTPWLPLVGHVVGVEMPMTEEVRIMDAEGRKERLEWAVSTVLGRLLPTPTLFVFNDLYFMDEATIDLVRRLATDVVERPWLIVTTRRPDTNGDLESSPHIHVVNLEPLDDQATDRLLEAATALSPMPEHRLHALGLRAGGNPLFLIELAAASREFSDADQIPDSVEGVISARIDLLEPQHRRVLRSASVLGMTVDLEVLDAILRVEAKAAHPTFDRWDSLSEFLVPIGNGQLAWAHHLVRDTAYEGLSYRRRVLLHGRTADTLETRLGERAHEQAALLSEHCFNGERFHPAWTYARLAADRARDVYANADAATLYRRALGASDRMSGVNREEFIETCESLSSAYEALSEFDSAELVLARARHRVGNDPLRMAQVELKTAIIRHRKGRHPVALRGLTRAMRGIADLSGVEASAMRASLLTRYAWIRCTQGLSREMILWAERGIAEATACDDKPDLAHCLEVLEWGGITSGEIPEVSPAAQALAIYQDLGDVAGQASIYLTLGAREYYRWSWNQAVAYYRSAEDAYRRCGCVWGTVMPIASRAEILSDQGHLEEAAATVAEALRITRTSGVDADLAFVLGVLGRNCTRSGEYDDALASLLEARSLFASASSSAMVQMDGFIAECQLEMGQPEAALATAELALRAARDMQGVGAFVLLLQRIRASALIASGQIELGCAELRACADQARKNNLLPDLVGALQTLLTASIDASMDERKAWSDESALLRDRLGLVHR
jgi:tetratricopeptide (TPR) repeat protein